MEKITNLEYNQTIDFSQNEIVDFWLKNTNVINNDLPTDANWISILASILPNNSNSNTIVVQSLSLTCPILIKQLQELSKINNTRIYILTNQKKDVHQPLAGNCLIRYAPEMPSGSFILVNPKDESLRKGIFINADMSNEEVLIKNITLELDHYQVQDLFNLFVQLFWHKAKTELLTQQDFNIPAQVSPSLVSYQETFFVTNKSAISAAIEQDFTKISSPQWLKIWTHIGHKSEILIENKAIEHKNLMSFEHQEIRSANTLLGCFALTSADKQNGIFFSQKNITSLANDNYIAIQLNPKQYRQLNQLFDTYWQKASYFYVQKAIFSTLLDKEIQPIHEQQLTRVKPIKIIANSDSLNQKNNKWLSKAALQAQKPDFAKQSFEYLVIQYNWSVFPFILPNNAKKDDLYEVWRKYKEEKLLQSDNLMKGIEQLQARSESVKNLYPNDTNLSRDLLSSNQVAKSCIKKLQALTAIDTDTIAKAKEADAGFQELFALLVDEIAVIENKALEAEVRKFEQYVQTEKTNFNSWNQLQEQKRNAEKETAITNCKNYLDEHKIIFTTDNQGLINIGVLISDMAKKIRELKNAPKNETKEAKDMREAQIKELEKHEKTLNANKALIDKPDSDYQKARQQAYQKVAILEKAEKKRTAAPATNIQKGSELSKFAQKNTHANQQAQHYLGYSAPQIPKEDLPENKELVLFSHNNKRYLVLEFWEQEAEAQLIADRLKAELSAKPLSTTNITN